MANPTQQGFFVPDLLSTLPNTLASIIDQRVNAIVDQRFADIEQRLAQLEALVNRPDARLNNVAAPPPRQSPLRSSTQQQQQQQQQQQHHQQQQQTPQQQQPLPPVPPPSQQHHQQQQQQQQQHAHQQHAQFTPNPPVPPPHNDVDNDPVMALANANTAASIAPSATLQQQQQLPPPPTNPAVVHALSNVVPMEIPPEGYPISSRATMQLELDQFTIPRGYSMRMSGTRDMGKGKRKIRWICFRAGEARYSEASKAAGMPERTSKKCNCPFKFECVETFRDSNMWVVHHHITPGTTSHNHSPSDPSEDPRSRKLPPQVSVEVDGWLRQGWQVSKIMSELKNRGFKNVLNRDLYNRRQQLKREEEG